MSKPVLAGFLILGASLSASSALARDQAAPVAPAALPTTAPEYLRMAGSGDLFEIRSSQLALQLARSGQLRSLARTIMADHTRLGSELSAAASAAGMAPSPPALTPHHAEMLSRLQSAGQARFDALYRQQQIAAHQEAVALHRGYAASGDLPALRQAATRAVPVVEMHLQHVQALRSR